MAYLRTQTTSLSSSSPVPASQARAAQIPLQSFSIPVFPREAFNSGLTALILTADVKLDEYTTLLEQPFSVPDLPSSIDTLTLELFSLGYPSGFLKVLGEKLPNLKALTIYSQLLSGTSPQSRKDAILFFQAQEKLREVHLLDVFGPKGFFTDLASALPHGLKFLEINYTYRHSDPGFLSTVPRGSEMGKFVGQRMVGLTMCMSAPDITDDEDDREGTEVGILPMKKGEGSAMVTDLVERGKELVMLDVTLFELGIDEVNAVLDACSKLRVGGFTVALEKSWKEVFDGLESAGREEGVGVEVLELVGVPGENLVESIKSGGEASVQSGDLKKLGVRWRDLKSVKVSLLRTRGEMWVREVEGWVKK